MDVKIHVFLSSALGGSEWPSLSPDPFIPGRRAPGSRWTGDWVEFRAGLDPSGLELRPPSVVEPAASRYTGCTLPPNEKSVVEGLV
jgi:hypothetical protein